MEARKRKAHETEDESEVEEVQLQNSVKIKKKMSNQKFLASYNKDYPCIVGSRKSSQHAFCTICKSDFSVSHGGLSDCKKHCEGRGHKSNVN